MKIVEVPSRSDPRVKYRVDVTHGRCSCKHWIYHLNGTGLHCRHIKQALQGRKQ